MLLGLTFVNAPKTQAFGYSNYMVKMLSQKLGVDENKVKQAIDSIQSERHKEMAERLDNKLSQMVKDGKLTENQKKLILAKHKEMEKERASEMEKLKSMTPEERKSHMEKKRAELTAWAKENDIDLSLTFGFKHMKLGNRGYGMGRR